jgi:hypothetical protein
MNWLRKLLIAPAIALSLLSPAAFTAKADAGCRHSCCRCYRVYYRACECDCWTYYGRYTCYNDAWADACALADQGYYAIVE